MFQKHWPDTIVAVYKCDIFACGYVQSHISGCTDTAVFLVDYPDTWILRTVGITDFSAAVGRTIINQYQFKVLKSLIQDTVHTDTQLFFGLINRHYYTNFWHMSLTAISACVVCAA